MRLPRISIRSIMIIVAAVGIALWGMLIRQRSRLYSAQASRHRFIEEISLYNYNFLKSQLTKDVSDNYNLNKKIQEERSYAVYEGDLRRKYQRGARYPWLIVEPDPPAPLRVLPPCRCLPAASESNQ